ncbi:hypothetical protein ACVWY2_006796 [Bradyrhizobium sp. JR6.1]
MRIGLALLHGRPGFRNRAVDVVIARQQPGHEDGRSRHDADPEWCGRTCVRHRLVSLQPANDHGRQQPERHREDDVAARRKRPPVEFHLIDGPRQRADQHDRKQPKCRTVLRQQERSRSKNADADDNVGDGSSQRGEPDAAAREDQADQGVDDTRDKDGPGSLHGCTGAEEAPGLSCASATDRVRFQELWFNQQQLATGNCDVDATQACKVAISVLAEAGSFKLRALCSTRSNARRLALTQR